MLRVRSVSALPRGGDPEYAEGLRAAVSAGVGYGLEGVERGTEASLPVPEALLAQARLAARTGVGLDTVLRRYFAGHTLLEDFMVEEAERSPSLGPTELKRLLRTQAALVDRLLAAVSEAYAAEAERRRGGTARRRAELVERLLDGEPLETAELSYPFEGHHLALIARGPGAGPALGALAQTLDARPLAIRRGQGVHWLWLGSARPLDPEALHRRAQELSPPGLLLAIGEPAEGPAGWRLSHRQAGAALTVAQRGPEPVVRYAEVALLSSILQDDLLVASLRRMYLEPLRAGRDGGAALTETLRAYFAAGRNVSSAAAALGVSWQTVKNRLGAIEALLGRSLDGRLVDVEIALALAELQESHPRRGTRNSQAETPPA